MSPDHRPILAAYDGSDESRAAITVAGGLFAGRDAVVLNVFETPLPSGPSVPGAPLVPMLAAGDPGAADRLTREAQSAADAIAAEGARLAEESGLRASAECAPTGAGGGVADTIVGLASEFDAGVIVVGSRGRSALKSAVLGSVSRGLVQHADRPVLVVPGAPDPADAPSG